MAKNIRIVPASGSIFFTADGFDVTGSIRLQTVGSTENVQFIDGENNESLILIKLSEFGGTPAIVDGGLYYSSSNFFVGI